MFTPELLGGRPPKTGAAGVAPALIFTPEPLGGRPPKTGAEGVAPTFGLTVPAGLELPARIDPGVGKVGVVAEGVAAVGVLNKFSSKDMMPALPPRSCDSPVGC